MTQRRRPPLLLKFSPLGRRFTCHTCRYMDRSSGLCKRYRWKVKRPWWCAAWQGRGS